MTREKKVNLPDGRDFRVSSEVQSEKFGNGDDDYGSSRLRFKRERERETRTNIREAAPDEPKRERNVKRP